MWSITRKRCVYVIFVLLVQVSYAEIEQLRECHLDDYHYEYTECDSKGGRWRVPVPKEPQLCKATTVPGGPVRGKDCNFACNPGEYLDIQGDQECHPCPGGSYSLGGGIRFDEWEELPSGFAVKTEHVAPSSWSSKLQQKGNCSRSEWTPRGDYIMSVPGLCPSNLLYSAKLVRAGRLTFEYQYTDPESIFHFVVQNDQCQAMDSEDTDKWPEVTTEGKWSTVTVNLKSGMNVLQWRTIGALSELVHASVSPVLIRKIEITGVAYTSECTKCANGTYSSGGTSFCQLCPADHFSVHGATQCEACKSWEYAEPGSAHCTTRPPCTEFDYYVYQKPCDDNGKTRLSYKWAEPRVCYENASGSVLLPTDGPLQDCPPCNLGMYRVNYSSHCEFCDVNSYADADGVCHVCPASTSPNYSIDYKFWNVMPTNVSAHCVSAGVELCSKTAGWLPLGDHVVTNFGPNDHNIFLVLILKVAGFRGKPGTVDGKPLSLGTITFDMEMECETPCQLLFLSDATGRNAVIQSWETTSPRKTYSHEIFTNESLTFTWAFQPDDFGFGSQDLEQIQKRKNVAKIYSMKVTDTIAGGATMCQSCPEGKTEEGCIPCPDGHYIEPKSQDCEPCPFGTVLPSSNSWGKESCKPCGPGLHPVGGRSCKSDCHFSDNMGRDYDFTELDKVRFVAGSRLFTGSGTQYYHGFNISLCNHGTQPLPTCVNNVTSELVNQEHELMPREKMLNKPGFLSSMVCRSTLVPQADPEKPLVSTQPVSLGTHLTKIVTNISLHGLYKDEGFTFEDTERDIHFYYESGSSTNACPNGRTSIISLRCDPSATSGGTIELPPKCSDGTCDGCTFHFLWKTVHACPRCRREDYTIVRGECINGEQTIHYIPPEDCLHLPEELLTPMKQKCSVLPFSVVVAIPVSVGVALILVLLLIYCWSRNKKLEYKYMKLVETAGGQDGELPAVDTCGMEDDEEDVHFSEPSASSSFLGRVKEKFSSKRAKEDDNPFVAVKMSEKMPLT